MKLEFFGKSRFSSNFYFKVYKNGKVYRLIISEKRLAKLLLSPLDDFSSCLEDFSYIKEAKK